jgi:hypothetical protein
MTDVAVGGSSRVDQTTAGCDRQGPLEKDRLLRLYIYVVVHAHQYKDMIQVLRPTECSAEGH